METTPKDIKNYKKYIFQTELKENVGKEKYHKILSTKKQVDDEKISIGQYIKNINKQ